MKPKSPKLPNLNKEERAWLTIKLIGLKPRDVYEPFLERFPRLAEWADEHGISEEELKLRFSNRSYQINSERNSDFTGVMSNLAKLRILVFTDGALFFDMSSVEAAMKLQLENEAAIISENISGEELKQLKQRNVILDKNLKRVSHLHKLARDQVKFDILTQKVLTKEDTDPTQPKSTQTPGQTDWSDDNWLEGDDEIYRSGEYDESDYE